MINIILVIIVIGLLKLTYNHNINILLGTVTEFFASGVSTKTTNLNIPNWINNYNLKTTMLISPILLSNNKYLISNPIAQTVQSLYALLQKLSLRSSSLNEINTQSKLLYSWIELSINEKGTWVQLLIWLLFNSW